MFSDTEITAGGLIEICPVIIIADELEGKWLKSTQLGDYLFSWGSAEAPQSALALGFGSLYNHAKEANAMYVLHSEDGYLAFYSTRYIAPHEEITINYHGEPDAKQLTWFEHRNLTYVD